MRIRRNVCSVEPKINWFTRRSYICISLILFLVIIVAWCSVLLKVCVSHVTLAVFIKVSSSIIDIVVGVISIVSVIILNLFFDTLGVSLVSNRVIPTLNSTQT